MSDDINGGSSALAARMRYGSLLPAETLLGTEPWLACFDARPAAIQLSISDSLRSIRFRPPPAENRIRPSLRFGVVLLASIIASIPRLRSRLSLIDGSRSQRIPPSMAIVSNRGTGSAKKGSRSTHNEGRLYLLSLLRGRVSRRGCISFTGDVIWGIHKGEEFEKKDVYSRHRTMSEVLTDD